MRAGYYTPPPLPLCGNVIYRVSRFWVTSLSEGPDDPNGGIHQLTNTLCMAMIIGGHVGMKWGSGDWSEVWTVAHPRMLGVFLQIYYLRGNTIHQILDECDVIVCDFAYYFLFFNIICHQSRDIRHNTLTSLSRKDLVLAPRWRPPKTAQWSNVVVWNLKRLPILFALLLCCSEIQSYMHQGSTRP